MQGFFLGVQLLFDGFQLITKPGIKRFVLVPLLINVLLFIGLFFALRHGVAMLDEWVAAFLPSWLLWLTSIVWVIFFIGFFVMIIFAFITIANIIASPFNSFLSEKVEWYLTGYEAPSDGILTLIKDVPRVMSRQVAILFYYLPRACLLILLYFVPVVQAFAALISFFFHAFAMSLTYMDYPTDNHKVSFSEMKRWLSEQRLVALGFGSAVLVISMVPVLNFFVIPAAVSGATKWWVEQGVMRFKKSNTIN